MVLRDAFAKGVAGDVAERRHWRLRGQWKGDERAGSERGRGGEGAKSHKTGR